MVFGCVFCFECRRDPPGRLANGEGAKRLSLEQAIGLRPPRLFQCEFRRDLPGHLANGEGAKRLSLEQAFGLRPPRLFRCEFRRDPPGRLLIASPYSGGQSGEVFWEAFINFGFLG